jgi:hypothetical protein
VPIVDNIETSTHEDEFLRSRDGKFGLPRKQKRARDSLMMHGRIITAKKGVQAVRYSGIQAFRQSGIQAIRR